MPGWKTEGMRQARPHDLTKIAVNIAELQKRLRPEDTLLDVGCCEGHLFDYLRHKHYTGIDLFHKHIAEARLARPEARFRVMDLFDLEGQWDVVWCSRVLLHIPRFEEAVAKLKSCARRYCILVIPMTVESKCVVQREESDGVVYHRTFSTEQVMATNPSQILKYPNAQYRTVVYEL